MKTTICFCFVFLFAKTLSGGEYAIDSYQFDWKLANSGEASLILRKDEDSTRVLIGKSLTTLSMTPEEVIEVGTVLAGTTEISKSMKGSKGKSERIKAGKHIVTFQTTDQGSFFVSVNRDERFALRTLILDREDALAFVPHLKKAKEMAAYLEKVIDPNAKEAKAQDPVEAKKAAEIAKANADRSQADALRARAEADRVKAEAEKTKADAAIITAKRDIAKATEELEAAGIKRLVFAKQFLTKDKTVAKKRLTEIVENYPSTSAAEEAIELLKKLP